MADLSVNTEDDYPKIISDEMHEDDEVAVKRMRQAVEGICKTTKAGKNPCLCCEIGGALLNVSPGVR